MSRGSEFPFSDISTLELPAKPRATAITSLLDKGMGPARLSDLVAVAGAWIDVVKFGWATARVQPTEVLVAKLRTLSAGGIRACTGGTFLEVAKAQGRVETFLETARELGFAMVEVSNGVHPMSQAEKLELIEEVRAAGFTTWSEVGRKDPEEDARIQMHERLDAVRAELGAGAERVILEARESGTLGVFDRDGAPVVELVDRLVEEFGAERLIFETPLKSQQVWMMRHLGPLVNLANIAPDDAVSVATLRMGLRGDTFRDFQLPGVRVHLELGVGGALAARRRGGVVVVIDALRASGTIVAALGSGMTSVKPVASADECVGDVTAGERGGRKLPNLDHANSPTEIVAAAYHGRSLVLTTTNGTECLLAAQGGGNLVLVGTTLNASAVAAHALAYAEAAAEPVTLLMCGRNNERCVEDELAAAEILRAMGPKARLRGAAPHSSTALEAEFFAGDSGRNLVELGYADDVRFCARLDEYSVVPVFRDGVIVPRGS